MVTFPSLLREGIILTLSIWLAILLYPAAGLGGFLPHFLGRLSCFLADLLSFLLLFFLLLLLLLIWCGIVAFLIEKVPSNFRPFAQVVLVGLTYGNRISCWNLYMLGCKRRLLDDVLSLNYFLGCLLGRYCQNRFLDLFNLPIGFVDAFKLRWYIWLLPLITHLIG